MINSITEWKKMQDECIRGDEFCMIDDRWLEFSAFNKWFRDNYVEGYVLTRKVRGSDGELYSPESCAYVPPYINDVIEMQFNTEPTEEQLSSKKYNASGRVLNAFKNKEISKRALLFLLNYNNIY